MERYLRVKLLGTDHRAAVSQRLTNTGLSHFRQTASAAYFEEGISLCGECLNVLSYIEDDQESLKTNDYNVILKQTRNTLQLAVTDNSHPNCWLRHCATSWKVADSTHNSIIGIFL